TRSPRGVGTREAWSLGLRSSTETSVHVPASPAGFAAPWARTTVAAQTSAAAARVATTNRRRASLERRVYPSGFVRDLAVIFTPAPGRPRALSLSRRPMRTVFNLDDRLTLARRIDALALDAAPRWGRMDCPQMLAHLSESVRMALGELEITTRGPRPLRLRPIAHAVIHWLPFPK